MPPMIVIGAVVIVVALLVVTGWRRSSRGGDSTAGHYDPNAIGGYTLDPATMRYRYDLPTLPPGASPTTPGDGPPHRRRRRHRCPDAGSG
ncbi:MAG: hypothetical protein ACXWWU_07290 [Candidatus Limnocylindria bacterium]